jgi:putative FmdB family regulatory protein
MPIYEYKCQKCTAHVEILQKMSDKPLTKCKTCGGKLEKQWSNTSFQLKGSGWYVTDYAGKKAESSGDGKSTAGEASTSTSSETQSNSSEAKSGDAKAVDSKAADTKRESNKKPAGKKPAGKAGGE